MANPNETEEIQRGAEAKGLLGNRLLNEALDTIDKFHQEQWLKTSVNQTEEREAAYRMLLTTRTFRGMLTNYLDTGTLAEMQRDAESQQRALEEAD